jgi:hypothetical protein
MVTGSTYVDILTVYEGQFGLWCPGLLLEEVVIELDSYHGGPLNVYVLTYSLFTYVNMNYNR